MKRTPALILAGMLCLSTVAQGAIQLSPSLLIEGADPDATFQEVPAIGTEKYLCLWSGDALQGFLMTTHEETPVDWKRFLQHTELAMKREGAKSIKIVESEAIKAPGELEVRRLVISYKIPDGDVKQVYYVIKSPTGYHSVILTLTNPAAFDEIGARADKLMATVSIN